MRLVERLKGRPRVRPRVLVLCTQPGLSMDLELAKVVGLLSARNPCLQHAQSCGKFLQLVVDDQEAHPKTTEEL